MPRAHKPRSGSLQFWPRKRAKRQYPRIRSWADIDTAKLLGFMGYKVGMTHLGYTENNPNLKGDLKKTTSATIIECPPIKPFSLRFYKKTPYGLVPFSEILSKKFDKELSRKLKLPKKNTAKEMPKEFDQVRLISYTQPKLTSLPKKKPEIMEIKISKNDIEYAKSLLEQEIPVQDVFEQGKFIDIHSVTKGKGNQGPVKRFGIGLKQKKSEKGRRRPGSLGNWNAVTMMWTVAQAGQTGCQTRTEHNKLILKFCKPEEINKPSGFTNYGIVKNTCILLKGSIPGPRKRLIRLAQATRPRKSHPITIHYIGNTKSEK
ncbi:MAG: 50S ribosomal protein L3 [Nanoarchaeota archaeon]|nr:50S ribosomal protein L3 [Nanoarchaeota archaeon]